MTPAHVHGNDLAHLRQLTLAWIQGWHTSPAHPFTIVDVASLYSHDDTLTSFDFGRPAAGVVGWEAFAHYYQQFMDGMAQWTLTAHDDLRVVQHGDIAWSTVSLHGEGTTRAGQVLEMPEGRVTLIFEKRAGQWRIVHEHGSSALPIPSPEAVQAMLQR